MIVEKVIRYEVPGLGERIKKARMQSPKSVTALAAEAGMSTSNWYRIEKEEAKSLPEETLEAIEKALEIQLLSPETEGMIAK